MRADPLLLHTLERLAENLRSAKLTLDVDGVEEHRAIRRQLDQQVDDYVLPRLRRLDAPLLMVLGGSTGSGKSTITNTLVGRDVSPAGVLRPTTRAPVLVCHPDDRAWFDGDDILPDLPRQTGDPTTAGDQRSGGALLQIVEAEAIEAGVALLDAPDIDSVEEANRTLAAQLLSAADMWLFVTTAMRYADAVPWDFLRQAQDRGTALAIVVNRIPEGAADEIVPHLGTMLDEAGLAEVAVYPVEQTELVDGRIPDEAVGPLAALVTGLAADAERRDEVIRETLDGALASVGDRARAVAQGVRAQDTAVAELRLAVDRAHEQAREQLADDITSGNLLRGEVIDRWQELVGTAELMAALQSRIALVRDRLGSFIRGRTTTTAEVEGEITSTLEQLLIDRAEATADTVSQAWRNLPGGRQVLSRDESLGHASAELRNTVGAEVRDWQGDILELVRKRGAGKRTTARILSFGINSVGVALMVVLFSQTYGLSGGEIAISAGTATVSQALLSALFGDQAVRELAAEARRMLTTRIDTLMDAEAARYHAELDAVAEDDELAAQLERSAGTFEQAR